MRTLRAVKTKSLSDRVIELIFSCKVQGISELPVNEIARQMEVSVSHLSRTFKFEKKNPVIITGEELKGI